MRRSARQPAGTAPTAPLSSAADEAEPASPTVIYIAGSGRSGSTLLERVLGGMPGAVNVGELIDLVRRTAPRGELCGCGQAFAECPFWDGVGKRAFGGWEAGRLAEIHRLQTRVARQRHLPRLLAMSLADRGFRDDVATYGASYRALYQAIADEAGARYVIDASKWPSQALALARAGLDIRVIHLVRDVRGVAHSLSKQDVARPQAVQAADHMLSHLPVEAAARWVGIQTEAELLRGCGLRVTRMRYEDFVAEPRAAVGTALADLGLSPTPSDLAHIADDHVALASSHGLSGNPSRFSSGEITLRPDEAWRQRMPQRDRVAVTALGLPLLLRYGWRLGTRPAPGTTVPVPPAPPPDDAAWPPVTVIVPTRNRPELVRESIAAVVGQDYPGRIDCIVVHDQEPPDEDLARMGTERRTVRAVANSHTPGLPGARNTGLDLARAEFIASCDDDDTWHTAKLRLQIERLLGEPDLLVVGAGIRLMLPAGKIHEWPGRAAEISYQMLLRNRVKELHSSTLVMRREAFVKAGRYDEDLPNGHGEDYDWVLRAARAGRVGLIAQPLADIRKNAPSFYRGLAASALPSQEYMLAKHPDFARSRRGHARLLGQMAFARSVLGQRREAIRDATKALTRWPLSPHPYVAFAHIATGVDPRHLQRVARLLRRGMV
jgi:glycosyl transferase family 2/sulfotransferase family protein